MLQSVVAARCRGGRRRKGPSTAAGLEQAQAATEPDGFGVGRDLSLWLDWRDAAASKNPPFMGVVTR